MRCVCCTMAVWAVTLTSPSSPAADPKDDLKTLQGTWKLVGFERGGVARSPRDLPVGTITFEKHNRFSALFPDHEMGGIAKIDPTKKPKTIDLIHSKEPDKGKTQRAIYKLERGKLTMCSAIPGKHEMERPIEFTTRKTDYVLFVFERVEPLPPAPKGFDVRRDSIERGTVKAVEYDSKTVGIKRKLVVYTPPGYSTNAMYPVLYLLHGAGQDETAWQKNGLADIIFDNLSADRKLVPMIVVMPHGEPPGTVTKDNPFAAFPDDLLKDIIPWVESKYSVRAAPEYRAIAGLSKGGGQAIWIGLQHRDRFAWVGGFCSALTGDAATTGPVVRRLIGDPSAATKQLRLLWLSCGDRDELLKGNEHFHAALDTLKIPHTWHVDSGGHTWSVWKNDLYLFSQRLFRDNK